MPQVSVLLPVHNGEASLGAALHSLLRQTLTDWECVLCDDGSTDGTPEVIAGHARRDRRIVPIRCEHRGLVATLNRGLRQCRGEYVARLDADDLMHRTRLATQWRYLHAHAEYAGVGCGVRIFPRSGLAQGRIDYEKWLNGLAGEHDIVRDRFVECPLAHPTWLVKRAVLLAAGYRDRGWPEDYDLVLRLLGAGHRLSTVPQRLLFWRDHVTRLSRTHEAYGQDAFTRCRAHFLAKDWLNGNRYGLWGYGNTGRNLARALAALGKHPSYIVELHPGRIGQRILGVPVIAPHQLANHRERGDRLIVSVAGSTNRADARRIAQSIGLVESIDFVCAA